MERILAGTIKMSLGVSITIVIETQAHLLYKVHCINQLKLC